MAAACCVCTGNGRLLDESCPLCDGDPFFLSEGDAKHDAPLPIFILAGQSNCVGRGNPEELPSDLVERISKSVRICFDLERHRPEETHTSGWVSLTPQCQVNPQFGKHFGPEFSIADGLLPKFKHSELLVAKFAMGSSSLVMPNRDNGDPEWNPEGEHMTAFIQFLRDQCKRLDRPAYFAGIFWNQGNSDLKVKESDESSKRYSERLVALVTCLRHELQLMHRGLPFVACHVRKGSKAKTTQNVNAAISKACDMLENATCVELPESVTLLPGDEFHFDGQSLLSLGSELASAMCKLLNE